MRILRQAVPPAPCRPLTRVVTARGARAGLAMVPLLLGPALAAQDGADRAPLCVRDGAHIEITPSESGASRRICVFPNGSRIDEEAYFRNKHRLAHPPNL